MRTKLIILGAGGHGKVLADLASLRPEFEIAGLLDDTTELWGASVLGYPVLGPVAALAEMAGGRGIRAVALGIGDNRLRREWFERVSSLGMETPALLHPAAVVSAHAEVGRGVVALAGVVVNAGAVLGDNACLNTGASVDHDCWVGPHCHVFPNAVLAGGVRLGEYAVVGSNAVINPNVRIGRRAFVGAGAVVLREVGDDEVVVGNPARLLRKLEPVGTYP